MGLAAGEGGGTGRIDQYHDRDVAGPEPGVLLDVKGRPAAKDVLFRASEVSDSVDFFAHRRADCRDVRFAPSSCELGRNDEHRNASGVHYRERRGVGFAEAESGVAASVPGAMDAGDTDPGNSVRAAYDGFAPADYVVPAGGLAGHR